MNTSTCLLNSEMEKSKLANNNEKAKRRINKLCKYIDQLLEIWKNEKEDYEIAYQIAHRADFIARILGLKYVRMHSMGWGEIKLKKEKQRTRLKDWENFPVKDRWKKPVFTKERLEEIKQQAKAINHGLPEIEEGTRRKGQRTEDKLEELLSCLHYISEVYRLDAESSEIDVRGKRAIELILEMGLYSKWYKLALEVGLIKETKLPYHIKPNSDGNILSMMAGVTLSTEEIEADEKSKKEKVNKWIVRTEKLLNNLRPSPTQKINSNQKDISFDNLKHPISCIRLAGLVRETSSNVAAKMKRHKFTVIKRGGNNYCDLDDAKILWPTKSKTFHKKIEEMTGNS